MLLTFRHVLTGTCDISFCISLLDGFGHNVQGMSDRPSFLSFTLLTVNLASTTDLYVFISLQLHVLTSLLYRCVQEFKQVQSINCAFSSSLL